MDHKIKADLLVHVKKSWRGFRQSGMRRRLPKIDSPYIEEVESVRFRWIQKVKIRMELAETFYYELLSELTGTKISGEYECQLER